jgi:hypothetical protein
MSTERRQYPTVNGPSGHRLNTQVVGGTFSTIVRVYDEANPSLCVERNVYAKEWQAQHAKAPGDMVPMVREELIQEWIDRYAKKEQQDEASAQESSQALDGDDELIRRMHDMADAMLVVLRELLRRAREQ